jgi:hypothetical protein
MLDLLLLSLMLYAACGLTVSLAVHLLSFAGIQPGGTQLFTGLHVGIFPLWIVVVLLAQRMSGGSTRLGWRGWWALLEGCPRWMKLMTQGFFIYALVNFVIFMILVQPQRHSAGGPPSVVWHGFSGHWMAFYSAGLAILTAAYRRGLGNLAPKCPNGHAVGIGDKFCPTCGAAISASQVPSRA